ncbi:unnamed protein product, partial [Mycena citricolor]
RIPLVTYCMHLQVDSQFLPQAPDITRDKMHLFVKVTSVSDGVAHIPSGCIRPVLRFSPSQISTGRIGGIKTMINQVVS